MSGLRLSRLATGLAMIIIYDIMIIRYYCTIES